MHLTSDGASGSVTMARRALRTEIRDMLLALGRLTCLHFHPYFSKSQCVAVGNGKVLDERTDCFMTQHGCSTGGLVAGFFATANRMRTSWEPDADREG
jgi:hypothetical protein